MWRIREHFIEAKIYKKYRSPSEVSSNDREHVCVCVSSIWFWETGERKLLTWSELYRCFFYITIKYFKVSGTVSMDTMVSKIDIVD